MENKVLSFLEKLQEESLNDSVSDETVYSGGDLKLQIPPTEEAVIYLYARVSSVKEQQVDAVKYQTSNLERWLDKQCSLHSNWHKGKTFVDIKTGRNFKRDAYQKMMREVRKGGVTYIVFWETSRFGRTFKGVITECIDLQRNYGVDLYFIDKGIDTRSPDGLERLAEEAKKADAASKQTKLRVDRGIKEKREVLEALGDGYLFTTRALGLIRKPGIKQKLFKVDSEVETLNLMANHYLKYKSLSKTARYLTDMQRETVNGSTYWDASTVYRCLHNSLYVCIEEQNKTRVNSDDDYYNGTRTRISKSKHVFKYLPDRIERIWDNDFFMLIQDTLRANRREWTGEGLGMNRSDYSYKDLLWCDCGGRYNLHSRTADYGKNWYECHNQKHKASEHYITVAGLDASLICRRSVVQDWKLDMMVDEILKELQFTKEKIVKNISEMVRSAYVVDDSVDEDLINIDSSIKDIKKEIGSARTCLYKGLISEEEYENDTAILRKELSKKESERERLMQSKKENDSKDSLDLSTLEKTVLEKLNYILENDRNKFMYNLVYMIVHTSDNEFTWVLNLFEDSRDRYIDETYQLKFIQRIHNRVDEVLVDSRNLLADFEINEFTARTYKKRHNLGTLKQYETLRVKVYY